jgi:hypothetical protein
LKNIHNAAKDTATAAATAVNGAQPGDVHGRDAPANHERAPCQSAKGELRAARDVQGKCRRAYGEKQRPDRRNEVKGQGNWKCGREHADEVHRPDTGAHDERAAGKPTQSYSPGCGGDFRGQAERGVRNEHSDRYGKTRQPRVVRTDHAPLRVQPYWTVERHIGFGAAALDVGKYVSFQELGQFVMRVLEHLRMAVLNLTQLGPPVEQRLAAGRSRRVRSYISVAPADRTWCASTATFAPY